MGHFRLFLVRCRSFPGHFLFVVGCFRSFLILVSTNIEQDSLGKVIFLGGLNFVTGSADQAKGLPQSVGKTFFKKQNANLLVYLGYSYDE